MTQAELADQPALGPDGQLLDASKIVWYNDPDDPHPIQSASTPSKVPVQEGNVLVKLYCVWQQLIHLSGQVGQRSRPTCATAGTRLAEAITTEKLDENGQSCCRFILRHDAKASAKHKRPTTNDSCGDAINTDMEDETFAVPVSEGGSDGNSLDSDVNEIEVGNEEVYKSLLISA